MFHFYESLVYVYKNIKWEKMDETCDSIHCPVLINLRTF